MTQLEDAANRLKELAEKIVRCAERCDSYKGVYDMECQELERLKKEHAKAGDALIEAAQGHILKSVPGYYP